MIHATSVPRLMEYAPRVGLVRQCVIRVNDECWECVDFSIVRLMVSSMTTFFFFSLDLEDTMGIAMIYDIRRNIVTNLPLPLVYFHSACNV